MWPNQWPIGLTWPGPVYIRAADCSHLVFFSLADRCVYLFLCSLFTYFLKAKSDTVKSTEKFIADVAPHGKIDKTFIFK